MRRDDEEIYLSGRLRGAPCAPMPDPEAALERLDARFEKLNRDLLVICWMQGATLAGVLAIVVITIDFEVHVWHAL